MVADPLMITKSLPDELVSTKSKSQVKVGTHRGQYLLTGLRAKKAKIIVATNIDRHH